MVAKTEGEGVTVTAATCAPKEADTVRKRRIRHILRGGTAAAYCGFPYHGERQYEDWAAALRGWDLCVVCDDLYKGPRP